MLTSVQREFAARVEGAKKAREAEEAPTVLVGKEDTPPAVRGIS